MYRSFAKKIVLVLLLAILLHMQTVWCAQADVTTSPPSNRISGNIATGIEKQPVPSALSISAPVTVESQQDATGVGKEKNLTGFFAIGLLVNILMMTLFGVWAVRQWRKTGKKELSKQ